MSRAPTIQDVTPVLPVVTDDEAREALVFLDTTDERVSELKAVYDKLDFMLKQTEAAAFRLSDESSNERKRADALVSNAVSRQLNTRFEAQRAWLWLHARREGARTRVEVWRTLRADARARDQIEARRDESEGIARALVRILRDIRGALAP